MGCTHKDINLHDLRYQGGGTDCVHTQRESTRPLPDFSHNCKIKSGSGLQKENIRGVCNGQEAGGNQGKM